MEGLVSLGANVGSSWALVRAGGDLHTWEGPVLWWVDRRNPRAMLFTLNDATEGKDWERVKLVARALNTVLGALRDVIDPIGQVQCVRAFSLDLPFFALLTCVVCSLSCLTVMRSPHFFISRRTLGTALLRGSSCVDG